MFTVRRNFFKGGYEVIKSRLTLAEAKEHCSDTETSSKTCTTPEALAITEARGPWFDSFDEE